MTGPESEKLGELAGELKGLTGQITRQYQLMDDRHRENKGQLDSIHNELTLMRERSTIAATVAKEFSDFKQNEHVPLRNKVDSLVKWRIYLSGAVGMLTVLFTITLAVAKLWNVF